MHGTQLEQSPSAGYDGSRQIAPQMFGYVFAGPATPVEVVVYGMTAAFGLEYLMASWRGLWRSG